MSARAAVGVLAITHAVAIGGGYLLAPKVLLDEEVKHEGFFQIDTTKILSTTVESLREENRLLIYSYKGGAKVQAERTRFWLFGGRQELNVPAVVNYYLNLSDLSLADVSYNDTAKVVTVRLPKVTIGDIAFQPERATTIWTCFRKVESFPELKGELDDEAATVYKGIRGRGGPAGGDQRAHAA